MSSRVTRSSAKKSANASSSASIDLSNTVNLESGGPQPRPTRKRKASSRQSQPTTDGASTSPQTSTLKAKRVKSKPDPQSEVEVEPLHKSLQSGKKSNAIMPTSPTDENPTSPSGPSSSSKKKSGKSKKASSPNEPTPTSSKSRSKTSSSSKKRGSSSKKEKEKGELSEEPTSPDSANKSGNSKEDASDEPPPPPNEDESDPMDDRLGGMPFGRSGGLGGLGGLASFGGMASYITSVVTRMRDLLTTLQKKDDPLAQHEALAEISEMLLISTEDNLAGHFHADAYAKEFVSIASMAPTDPDYPFQLSVNPDLGPQMRLLATRCIANMIEALPSSTAAVVYNGAVPMLISKLMVAENFEFELAEQALTTLEKISAEFPSAIVREGGLSALLQNLDFFTSSVQRTGVTAAANCCRNIPEDSFSTIKEVMPRLRDVLKGSDQKVVEQGCLCITRIVDSFKSQDEKLEELMDADLLGVILRLLLPGSTNFISPSIHTQFLRVLSTIARASPSLTKELFKMDVTDTLYQILTGVSAPSQDENVASNIDSVVVMQALIHRPRDQVFETLRVVCELLPGMDAANLGYLNELTELSKKYLPSAPPTNSSKAPIDKRLKLLGECKKEMKRFAMLLLPTLTDAYSSTVNLQVRQLVLTAQLKMLCNLDTDILEEALRPVPYASHLASILSQQDHPFLVTTALQAAELLLQRLDHVYRYQFYREGVIAEVRKIANRPVAETSSQTAPKAVEKKRAASPSPVEPPQPPPETEEVESPIGEDMSISDGSDHDPNDEDDENHEDDDAAEDIDVDVDIHEDDEGSSVDSDGHEPPPPPIASTDAIQDMITRCARSFIAQWETPECADLRTKATQTLDDLNGLVSNIADCYASEQYEEGAQLFSQLAKSFEGNALESITSYELLSSRVVHTLVDIFDVAHGQSNLDARAAFIEAFMSTTTSANVKTGTSASPTTPFSILVQKLQDLLSRAEHFEVVTINSNAYDSNRSSPTSALSKQIRIRLVAEGDDSNVPTNYRTIMVSIHAIATLKSLEEYLRPRIALGDRPNPTRAPHLPGSSHARDMWAAQLAAIGDPHLARRMASTPNPFNDSSSAPPATARSSSARRAPKTPKSPTDSEATAGPSSTSTPQPRRSARKTRSQPAHPSTPPAPSDNPAMAPSDSQNTLECADEEQVSDDDDETFNGSAILPDIGDEIAGSPPDADPSAVNVDVTPGGAVTTRVDNESSASTPSGRTDTPPVPRPSLLSSGMSALPPGISQRLAHRSLARSAMFAGNRPSYASALASTPTDWHLQFSANGRSIPSDMTVYKAVHTNTPSSDDPSNRNVWMSTHTVHFKRVNGPPPQHQALSSRPVTPPEGSSALPQSLEQNPITAVILRLLRILHEINSTVDELLGDKRKVLTVNREPLSQFVNTKLTAKMNRQLEEPLIVASHSLPNWSEDLARIYPFLFPFETRHLFLQSTSFGYHRSMQRWLNASEAADTRHRHREERSMLGRLQRQKVRIQRQRFLESAVKVMESYGANASILEVEYFDEVGTGLGPTLEFYASASKEFSKKKLKLWRENESSSNSEFAFGKNGLFPIPMTKSQLKSSHGEKVLKLFSALGKFVARSLLDSRIIDVLFNPMFFRWGTGPNAMPLTTSTLKVVDEDLAKSLMTLKQFDVSKKKILEQKRLSTEQKHIKISGIRVANASIDDLGLNFTLPGYPEIELIAGGKNIDVNINNVGDYVDKVIDFTIGVGVKDQIQSFRDGFSEVFPYAALRAFTPDELVMLFGRVDEDWSMETLTDSIKADHGYNLDSRSVRNLLQTMTEFTPQQRRDFLQFVTGSPKLPIGGFKSLTPMFTVVLRPSEPGHHADEYLPSCMTCVNYLKLPDYSDLAIMKLKLGIATQEGQGAFHLS